MKKCPRGVICIENITLFLTIILLLIFGYLIYLNYYIKNNSKNNKNATHKLEQNCSIYSQPNYPYNNLNDSMLSNNVLLNPYTPPLKDERYLVNNIMPINTPTNISAVDTAYRQIGILTPLNGPSINNILPLMGRPLITRRSLWNYYTISNQHNNIKLPISVKGRSGLNNNGVDEIFSGDTVYVDGYNDAFKVNVYDNDTIRYLPIL